MPSWIEDPEFDLDNHVRYSAVPEPGSTDQLLKMVSGIHSHALDRSRPLWECYLIEGLSERRVAIYFKVHHALLDGGSALAYMLCAFLKSSEDQVRRAFWQPVGEEIRQPQSTGLLGRLGKVAAELVSQAKALPELSQAVARSCAGRQSCDLECVGFQRSSLRQRCKAGGAISHVDVDRRTGPQYHGYKSRRTPGFWSVGLPPCGS